MAGVHSNINLGQFSGRLRQLGPAMRRAMHTGLVEGAHRIVAQVQQEIETTAPHKPVDTGVTAAGYRARRTARGAMVTNSVPQALWIERGRRPGPVSEAGVQHIADWVKRKRLYLDELTKVLASHKAGGIQLKADKRGRVRKAAIEEACNRVAHAIAHSIARRGYAPRYPLRRAIGSSRHAVAEIVRRHLLEVSP